MGENSVVSLYRPDEPVSDGSYHLVVLMHGLWGNGSHLNYLTKSLRERFSEDEVIVLVCKKNASSYTYDGIEVGAERVTREIEETLSELKQDGFKVDRLSLIGYSLGGLIARYTAGLLDTKGYFDNVKPVNFTTFATPHIGVRTPTTGYTGQLYNILGASTLSASGKQLFLVDTFRDTGRPLIAVLADPDSIFMQALAKFQNRSLYSNIQNDRTVPYFTSSFSRTDPYVDTEKLTLNYVSGYENIVLNPGSPYRMAQPRQPLTFAEKAKTTSQTVLTRIPIFAGLSVLLPIAVVVFFVNSGIQTFRSQKRILLHESDTGIRNYRTSWMVRDLQARLENVLEAGNAARPQQYLTDDDDQQDSRNDPTAPISVNDASTDGPQTHGSTCTSPRKSSAADSFPTLALLPEQFAMIEALDKVRFTKYRIHLHDSSHTHAAIIVRQEKKSFNEGKIVVKHWLTENFIL